MSTETIARTIDRLRGPADSIGLPARVARNVTTAVACSNLTYHLFGQYLGLAPSALTRRIAVDNEWRLREIDALCRLLSLEPCMIMGASPLGIATEMADRRSAIRGFYADTPNPSTATVRVWLSAVYSEDYATLVLGSDDAHR